MNERENIRFRLRVNNLTSTWLINMLAKSGIVTDRSTMSAILNGTRNGDKVDEIVAESLRILFCLSALDQDQQAEKVLRKLISVLCLSAIICLLASPFMKPTAEVVQTSPAVEVVEVPTPIIFEPVETPQPWTHDEVAALAKMLWGEARGVPSETEQAACVWCVLNRVDQGYGSILEVVTAPSQFVGYRENNPIDETLWLLSEDVLTRWQREKDGETEVGRVLPPDYLWFSGDGYHNYFRNAYHGGNTWDWQYESPYES